jgi:hypothetical protein
MSTFATGETGNPEGASVETKKRFAEDTLCATTGGALGAGLGALISLVLPIAVAAVPVGLVAGGAIGLALKELAQRKR